MQSFVDQVMATLNQEVNALERGIHGYFPFGQRRTIRHQGRFPHANPSLSCYADFIDESDTFSEDDDTDSWINDAADPAAPASRRRPRTSTRTFLRNALRRIRHPRHPLHFLVVTRRLPNGQVTYDWRKTTRTTASGRRQTGRYEGNEHGPVIQVGHQGAFAAGVPERLMLEDADLNQQTGRTIESKGAYSFKDAVMIGGVPVDVASAQQWERLGLLRRGTVARSPRIPAPMP